MIQLLRLKISHCSLKNLVHSLPAFKGTLGILVDKEPNMSWFQCVPTAQKPTVYWVASKRK